MSWNYRVVARKDTDGDEYYGIYEVYYDNQTQKVIGFCADPIIVWDEGEDPNLILDRIRKAVTQPYLQETDIGGSQYADQPVRS